MKNNLPSATIVNNPNDHLLLERKSLVPLEYRQNVGVIGDGDTLMVNLPERTAFAGYALELNPTFIWKIATDDSGHVLLIPTRNNAEQEDAPNSDDDDGEPEPVRFSFAFFEMPEMH